MHLITKIGGTGGLTTGRCPRGLVIPRGEESASFADREVRHPLGLGGLDVGVQLERRTESHATVSGTDIKDVARITRSGVTGGINVANYMVECGRLTPAHVPPVSRTGVHRGEEARSAAPGAIEGRPCVGVGPGVAAVSGTVDFVGSGGKAATHLIHACDVHVAGNLVASDLDVADEVGGDRYRSMPGTSVITGIGDAQSSASDIKIVPGNVHPVGKRRGWVVIGPARIAVVRRVVMNAEMGPASGVRGIGGLVATEALTAASPVQPHGKPGGDSPIVQNNRVAKSIGEGTLTAGGGEAVKSGATVSGNRTAGDVDGSGVAAT